MNNDQLAAYGRQILTIIGTMVGTWLVASGKISSANLSTLSGGITTIAGALFTVVPIAVSLVHSFTAHSTSGRLKAMQDDPAIKKVEMHFGADNAKLAEPFSKVIANQGA